MKITNIMGILYSVCKRGHFFRCLFVCVGLLLSVVAWAQTTTIDTVTISYTDRGTTYYLAANNGNLTRTNTLGENCLWIRVETGNQYTFQHLSSSSTQYLGIGTRQGNYWTGYYLLSLSSTANAAVTVSDNGGRLTYRNGNTNYTLTYTSGSWRFAQNASQTFTFTVFHEAKSQLSFEFVVNNELLDGSDNNFLTWLQPLLADLANADAHQQLVVRVKKTEYTGYISHDGNEDINYHAQSPVYLQGQNAGLNTYAEMDDNLQWVSGNADGNHYVALFSGPVWNSTTQGWVFTFRPVTESLPDGTIPDPLRDGTTGKAEVKIVKADGTIEYQQWLSQVKFTITHEGTSATSATFYLARATFHKEVGNGITLDVTPIANRFPWVGQVTPQIDYNVTIPAQTFTITGTNETGFRWVRADGTVITKGTYPTLTDAEILSLNNMKIEPLVLNSANDIRYRFFQETENIDLNPMWLEAWNESVAGNEVTAKLQIAHLNVTIDGTTYTTQANTTGAPRRARWIIAYDYDIDKVNNTKKTAYYALPIIQNSRYSDEGGLHMKHQTGLSGRDMVKNTSGHKHQGVHTLTTTLYYINDEEIELHRKERGYVAWTRWYDYTNSRDLGGLYVKEPTYRDQDGNSDFTLIGSMESTAHGRYFRRDYDLGNLYWGSGATMHKGEDQNYPTIRLSDGAPHTVAVDASNYIDFKFEAEHQPDPDNPTLQADAVTEPTLSTRQIFDIRPASERAAQLETVRTSSNHAARYNSETEKYLEDHKIVAPAMSDNKITLSPQYYYTNPVAVGRMAEFGYIYEKDGTYYRIGYTTGAEQAKWYRNGVETSIGTITSTELANVYTINTNTSLAGQTITYTLETPSYNLCRFVVEYKAVDEVGPSTSLEKYTDAKIEENYDVLATLDFDYTTKPNTETPAEEGVDYVVNTSGGTSIKFWNHPLEWEESTFGFRYGSSGGTYATGSSNRHPSRYETPPFNVGFGEYALVNKIDHSWWDKVTQRSGEDNGYMMYVDGSAEQGLVASLKTNASLCAGQKMYCSAWLSNPNSSDDTKPVLLFVIEGRFISKPEDKEWHSISEYTPGDLQGAAWQQVCFEISLEQDYDEYRVSIYNYATSNAGNDFCIDDIKIFASRQPLTAFQVGSLCSADYIDAVIRLDYTSMDMNQMEEGADGQKRMYADIYDETLGEALDIDYLNHPKPDPNAVRDITDRYGWVSFPISSEEIPEDEKYDDLVSFFEAIDDGASGEVKQVGYVRENVSGEEHWVVYVRHRLKIPDYDEKLQHIYKVRVGYHVEDLPYPTCAMNTYLPVRNAFDLKVNGETVTTPVQLCGNARYDVKLILNVTKTEAGDTDIDSKVQSYGVGLNDWIIMLNAPEGLELDNGRLVYCDGKAKCEDRDTRTEYRVYVTDEYPDGKYTYNDIENALRHDLRQAIIEDNINLNTNKDATTLAAIDSTLMTHMASKTHHNYTLIRELVEAGILVLAQEQVSPYVQNGDRVSCLVLPIKDTGYAVDEKGQPILDSEGNKTPVEQCFNPRVIELYAETTGHTLEIGTPEVTLPDAIRTNPTIVRTSLKEDGKPNIDAVALPIRAITEHTTIGNLIKLVKTTDPNFTVGDGTYAFSPDKLYELGKKQYVSGDVIKLQERRDGNPNEVTLQEGYDYTFEITMQQADGTKESDVTIEKNEKDENGKETTTTTTCAVGSVQFTLRIVPSYVKWNPQASGTSNWNDDNNWAAVDNMGNIIEGAKGFVPLAHTNVIIPEQDDDSKYPVLVDPATYMSEYQGLNAYEVGYQPSTCDSIYLQGNAKILNQEYLTYNGAFVDMKFVSNNWHILSAPLQEVYAGDYYTPGDPNKDDKPSDYDSAPFKPSTFVGNRWYDYAYYQSFYNQNVTIFEKDAENGKTQLELTDVAWSDYVNDMSLLHEVGKAYAVAGFGPTDDEQDLVVRLPKSDTKYYYYGSYGETLGEETITRTDARYQFAYQPNEGEMSITLQNNAKESKSFIFGNPTMAYINMFEFLSGNVLSTTFRYMDHSNWKTSTPLTASTNADYFLPPRHGVLIELGENVSATNKLTLTLKTEWLTLTTNGGGIVPMFKPNKTRSTNAVLSICAVNDEAESTLFLAESTNASDAIVPNEDARAIISTNASTVETPLTIYTSNEGVALNVDVRNQLTTHPICLAYTQAMADTTDLWFAGAEQFDAPIYFVDTIAGTVQQVLNGLCIRVATPARGEERYFIRAAQTTTDTPTSLPNEEITVPSIEESLVTNCWQVAENGIVMIAANMAIEHLYVYDITGREVVAQSTTSDNLQLTLPAGSYIFKVTNGTQTALHKLIVR